MTELFTFAKFEPGTSMGSVAMTLDEAFLARWRRIYPFGGAAGDEMSPAFSTVVFMNAWRTIVDPKPPGNVHAGQKVIFSAVPRLGESIDTQVFCLSKEERKGRKYVKLQTVSTGVNGRALFVGETNLIWAL